jgi:hypothetical protein
VARGNQLRQWSSGTSRPNPPSMRSYGLIRVLLPPCAPNSLRFGGERSGRADDLGANDRAQNAAGIEPAVAVVPLLHFVSLYHVGARREGPGPQMRPAGCQACPNRRTNRRRVRKAECSQGTARLGFACAAARSAPPIFPLEKPARTPAASLRH